MTLQSNICQIHHTHTPLQCSLFILHILMCILVCFYLILSVHDSQVQTFILSASCIQQQIEI